MTWLVLGAAVFLALWSAIERWFAWGERQKWPKVTSLTADDGLL
jgi:hypothetical protein